MQHQVQLSKKFPINILQSQIDSVKGQDITYLLTERIDFYTMDIKYKKMRAYTDFMERLHDLWRNLK